MENRGKLRWKSSHDPLMVARQANQVVMKSRSESDLFQRACDFLVKMECVEFAWIGLFEKETSRVRPVGYSVSEGRLHPSAEVAWDSDKESPACTAVKTSRPFVLRDLVTDPRYLPWRKEALKRGYLSSAALPLVYEEEAIGALNVYSRKKDAFGDEEVAFLMRTADDVAIGLRSIRTEQALHRSEDKYRTLLQNAKDLMVGLTAIMTDATDRKRLEEINSHSEHLRELVEERTKKLQESQERLGKFIDAATDAFVLLDSGLDYIEANEAALRFIGLGREHVIGKNLLEVEPEAQETGKYDRYLEVMRTGDSFHVEERVQHPKFGEMHLTVKVFKVGDGLGIITTDISEQKRMMELKGQFMSAVTHELRTPLVSIKGYVDFILAGELGPVPSKIEYSLQAVKRNTDRLLSLTDDLLDIQNFESGRLKLGMEPMSLRETIENAVEETRPLIENRKQRFQLELPDGSMPVVGDRIRLSQVVRNLLNNAVKFTPEGGTVTLRAVEEEKEVRVQVSDTGIGIRREDLSRVFEPFAAIKKPSYIKGTGLGLSLTKRLVEAHEGNIWVESLGEGRGTTFTFTLPKRKVS
mgnify:CR=1 FL=1